MSVRLGVKLEIPVAVYYILILKLHFKTLITKIISIAKHCQAKIFFSLSLQFSKSTFSNSKDPSISKKIVVIGAVISISWSDVQNLVIEKQRK